MSGSTFFTSSKGTKRWEEGSNVLFRSSDGLKTAQPSKIPASAWIGDTKLWPLVEYKDLFNYFVLSESVDGEAMKNYKSMESYQYFHADKVGTVYFHAPIDGMCILKAVVTPSQSEHNAKHQAWVLVTSSGVVEAAGCTCIAGRGQSCSHAGAILWKVEGNNDTWKTKGGGSDTRQEKCWIHFPDLSFNDFGREDHYSHWKIAGLFESAQYFAFDTEVVRMNVVAGEHFSYFYLGMHYKMDPEFWTVSRKTVFPYKISVEISDLGQSSLTTYSEMVNKLNGKTVASCFCKSVLVDPATRRPAPFPDWFAQMFAAVGERQKRPLYLTRTVPEVPVTAHCYHVTVAASDTDINRHTNHVSHVRFCCDAAQDAIRAQALRGFHQDIARYPLTEHEVIYIGESITGDTLQVFVWQPENQTDKILFVIKRQGSGSQSTVIFQSYMIFEMKQLPGPFIARM